MSKPWQTKEWREKRKFLKGKVCEWCRSDNKMVIHHKSYADKKDRKISDEQYLDFEGNEDKIMDKKGGYVCSILLMYLGRVIPPTPTVSGGYSLKKT